MQGRKKFHPRLFYQNSLDSLVPIDNYYRILDRHLDLHFLYSKTKKYYGRDGQESINSVVFFKILLVGYLKFSRKTPQIIAQSMTLMQGQVLSIENVLISFQMLDISLSKSLLSKLYKTTNLA